MRDNNIFPTRYLANKHKTDGDKVVKLPNGNFAVMSIEEYYTIFRAEHKAKFGVRA